MYEDLFADCLDAQGESHCHCWEHINHSFVSFFIWRPPRLFEIWIVCTDFVGSWQVWPVHNIFYLLYLYAHDNVVSNILDISLGYCLYAYISYKLLSPEVISCHRWRYSYAVMGLLFSSRTKRLNMHDYLGLSFILCFSCARCTGRSSSTILLPECTGLWLGFGARFIAGPWCVLTGGVAGSCCSCFFGPWSFLWGAAPSQLISSTFPTIDLTANALLLVSVLTC